MSAMFTQNALDGMRGSSIEQKELKHLFDILDVVDKAADIPRIFKPFGDVVQIHRDTFIVRVGELRAVIAANATGPDQIIVLKVYRGDQSRADGELPGLKESLAEGS